MVDESEVTTADQSSPSVADSPSIEASPSESVTSIRGIVADLGRLDRAVYGIIADTPTPNLDGPLRDLSSIANHSKIWLAIAGGLAVVGGQTGRRAALSGVVSIGATSLIANAVIKPLAQRRRPDREGEDVPDAREVPMPTSTSFPSGHSASAFAFASAVGKEIPAIGGPLRALAGAVAYSRVHTGVHYPTDVVVGAIIGPTIGDLSLALLSFGRRWVAARN